MARKFHRKERLSLMSEINMTPLIDLAFALLIIFMITTPLMEQSIDLDLPLETQAPQESTEDNFQVISIDPTGQYFWGKEPVTSEEMRALLFDLGRESNPPLLHIRADRSLQYQAVVDLVDLVKQAKLTRISLDTQVR